MIDGFRHLVRRTTTVPTGIGCRQDDPLFLWVRGHLLGLLEEVAKGDARVGVSCLVVRRDDVEGHQVLGEFACGHGFRQYVPSLHVKAIRFRFGTNSDLSTRRLTSFHVILAHGVLTVSFR